MSSGTNKERLTQNNTKLDELIDLLKTKSVPSGGTGGANGEYNVEVVIDADGTQILSITDWDYVPTPSFDPVFANNSWTQIAQASDIISENNYTSEQVKEIFGWDLQTDTKVDIGKDGIQRTFRINGFNHDSFATDKNLKFGITLGLVGVEPVEYEMNTSAVNTEGYITTTMRISTLPTIKMLLSDELQSIIGTVSKKSANGSGSYFTEVVTTEEQLFLYSVDNNSYPSFNICSLI